MNYRTIEEVVRDLKEHPVESSGNVYHPIPFPEFSRLTTSTEAAEFRRKWETLQSCLSRIFPEGVSGKRILDVGANAGFFSFTLAGEGARVTAYEPHPRYAPVGKFLAAAKGLPVDWRDIPISPESLEGERYDAGLMLSVYQWMAAGGEKLREAERSLRAISKACRYLFFELGFNTGTSCLNTSRRNHYHALISLLREGTVYRRYLQLGTFSVWQGAPRHFVLCSDDPRFDDPWFRRWLREIPI